MRRERSGEGGSGGLMGTGLYSEREKSKGGERTGNGKKRNTKKKKKTETGTYIRQCPRDQLINRDTRRPGIGEYNIYIYIKINTDGRGGFRETVIHLVYFSAVAGETDEKIIVLYIRVHRVYTCAGRKRSVRRCSESRSIITACGRRWQGALIPPPQKRQFD